MRETWVQSLGWEDLMEKGKATHSSIVHGLTKSRIKLSDFHFTSSEQSIIKKGMSEWNRLTQALNTNKKNIILLLKEPLSFRRSQEEALFLDLLSESRLEGKNILVLYRAEKTELVTLKDGVRVISLAYDSATITDFMKKPTEALKIYYNDSQMTYEIISDSLFLRQLSLP